MKTMFIIYHHLVFAVYFLSFYFSLLNHTMHTNPYSTPPPPLPTRKPVFYDIPFQAREKGNLKHTIPVSGSIAAPLGADQRAVLASS